ncbi:hypothetical protein F3I02_15830 [Bacillus sp. SRB3LM]|nr:hypothetical protein [Bacillus sp. SRB3LM]
MIPFLDPDAFTLSPLQTKTIWSGELQYKSYVAGSSSTDQIPPEIQPLQVWYVRQGQWIANRVLNQGYADPSGFDAIILYNNPHDYSLTITGSAKAYLGTDQPPTN